MKQVPPVGADTLIFRCKFVQLMQGVVRGISRRQNIFAPISCILCTIYVGFATK